MRLPNMTTTSQREHGFTMIEVLITLVILSIGLLGLAALQANSMASNHNAFLQSQATQYAYDMGDRMRANIAGVRAGNYNNASGIPADPACITAGCTPAQMATYDTFQWNTLLSQQLPAGQGTVTGDGTDFVISVMWDEARNGATGTDCDPADTDDLICVQLEIQP